MFWELKNCKKLNSSTHFSNVLVFVQRCLRIGCYRLSPKNSIIITNCKNLYIVLGIEELDIKANITSIPSISSLQFRSCISREDELFSLVSIFEVLKLTTFKNVFMFKWKNVLTTRAKTR
jgi:hypothetical protein